MKHYVCGFLFSPDATKVVLIRKNKPEWQRGKFNGVGGAIESQETPKCAMVREFREETGAGTTQEFWDHFLTMVYPDAVVYFFRGVDPNYQMVDTTTDEEITIVDIASIRQLPVIDNLRWIIPLALSPDCGEMEMGEIHASDGLMPRAREFSIQQLSRQLTGPLSVVNCPPPNTSAPVLRFLKRMFVGPTIRKNYAKKT